MSDYSPEVYLTKIGLRPEVLRKLNGDYIFTVSGLKTAGDERIAAVLTEDERAHLAERLAATRGVGDPD